MDAANIITETQHVNPECQSLTAQIQAAHQAICSAGRDMLREAERTARVYMQLAEHRDLIEAIVQHAADLSLRFGLVLTGVVQSPVS